MTTLPLKSPSRIAVLSLAIAVSCPFPGWSAARADKGAGVESGMMVMPAAKKKKPNVRLDAFVDGLDSPVDLQMPDDGSGRFFAVEQAGTIRIIDNGTVLPAAFLDIHTKVASGGEMGLLGAAFHPNFAQDGRFFVNYTRNLNGQIQTVIAQYRVSSNPDAADPASETILLVVDQPFTNHKAGQLAFGPDGFLYVSLGDGGGGGDPLGNGQNLQTLLGKMLRIDVDHVSAGKQYAIPSGNPFASNPDALPEIWAYGFRNPWRFSFDRGGSNRLFCADVGQDRIEEIDLVTNGGNYGWNVMEGKSCFDPPRKCNKKGKIRPIAQYTHDEGIAVIGGYVYRGSAISALRNSYVFGDFGSGTIWYLREMGGGKFSRKLLLQSGRSISAFGQDASGELYVVDYSGSVLKMVPNG
jgi:glucose/arabinose dehydrogenase